MTTPFRQALRSLGRSPGFTLTAILTLALGLGATTALFSILYAVLLRPFPYPQSDQLVVMWQKGPHMEMSISWPTVQDWMKDQQAFSALAAYRRERFNLSDPGSLPENVHGAFVSASFFDVVQLPPLRGRYFNAGEDAPGAAPTVVISEQLWERRFGRNPDLLGTTIPVDGVARTVVGIAPAALGLPRLCEVWLPIAPHAATQVSWQSRGNNPGIYSAGRLKPGLSLAQAEADMERLYRGLREAYPDNLRDVSARLQLYLDNQTGPYRTGLWSLFAATALVLAIACANVAGLFVTRGIGRERDYAVRAALGAGRGRLVREMLGESLLISIAGGVLALPVALGSLRLIGALLPANNVRFQTVDLNPWVLGFALLLAILSGLLAGLWPALRLSRTDMRGALHEGSRGATAGGGVRKFLVGAQVALTLVLLGVSGLILRSLENMQEARLGFERDSLLRFAISLPASRYGGDGAARRFYLRFIEELRQLPGVSSAALATTPPLNTGWQSSFRIEGQEMPEGAHRPLAEMNMVTDDYFATLRVPLLRGRMFGPEEDTGPRTAVIDQAFADKYWPGEEAIGRRIYWGFSQDADNNWFTVIGIVPTLQVHGYGQPPARVQAYISLRQFGWQQKVGLVRTEGNPRLLERPIRELLARLDGEIALYGLMTMDEQVAATYENTTLQSRLLTVFAGLALVLALTGLYSVVAYGVNARRREIGVRMALGATDGSVVGLMLRQSLLPILAGGGVGLIGLYAAGRAIQDQLYQIQPLDLPSLSAAVLLLSAAALFASWLPARRAARVNPVEALRAD